MTKRDTRGDRGSDIGNDMGSDMSGDMDGDTGLLKVRDLRIAFAGNPVVQGVNFHINAGERLALVGESGSGKTVTALSLLGLVQGAVVQGSAVFNNGQQSTDLLTATPAQMQAIRGQDIAMVFQEPMAALNPLFSIGEQIAEVLRSKTDMRGHAVVQATLALLADVGIADPQQRARAYPHQLSGGQRQRAMIAMALACRPQLLLADEPTTALDPSVRQQILDLLQRLQSKYGMAVLLITHDLHLVRRFVDRVAVMEGGHIVEQGETGVVFAHPQHLYTRRLLASRPQRQVVATVPNAAAALAAQHLSVAYAVPRAGWRGWLGRGTFKAVTAVNFMLPVGHTLGVIGESGSGKSTLALAALDLLPFTGEVQVMGQPWGRGRRADVRMRKDIQVVFQDPFSSLSPRLTVQEIVGEGLQVHAPTVSAQAMRTQVLAVLEQVGLSQAQFPGLLQRYPHQFSGGQRQRIAIARALIVRPRVLVLDEPTSALDVTMAQQVLQLLQKLQADMGLAYLLITHDVAVVQAMAHQVIVVKDGHIVESGPLHTVLEKPQHPYTQALLAAAL